jgi:threonine dehydrogenase-like Zn-dependent dehydrogenase
VSDIGAHYHAGSASDVPAEPDIVIECTGLGEVAIEAARRMAPGGVIALTGISQSDRTAQSQPDVMNKALVLGNKAVIGSVNAARRHYEQAADSLARADAEWLSQLITRRLSPAEWPAALDKQADDIKVVIDMTQA